MPRTLLVMRHAKSAWDTGEPDARRPLSPRGRRDATAAGRVLADYPVGCVLSSSSTRTRQTWEQARHGGASCPDVRFLDELYHAWTEEVLGQVATIPNSVPCALVLGHAPTMESLVAWLAEPGPLVDQVQAHFPTSALAVVEWAGRWDAPQRGAGRLLRFEVPRG